MKSIIAIIGVLLIGCSSLTPLQRQEIRQAKHEAHLARIKADTLSIQRTDNVYRNTGWNLSWNDPFYINRWGWNNQVYRPQIVIPIKKRKRNGRNSNTSYRRSNSFTKPIRKVNPTLPTRVKGRRGQKQ